MEKRSQKNLPIAMIAISLVAGAICPCVALESAPTVGKAALEAHLRFLADDLVEGRGIGSRGGKLAALYIETVFRAAGLNPGFDNVFAQKVPMYAYTPDPKATIAFGKDKPITMLMRGEEFVIVNCDAPTGVLTGQPLFVGYAINALGENWNDYKDTDVRGKILIAFANEPGQSDPKLFRGKALTIYGRWRTKFEEAARRGAAAMILIHTDTDAGYSWDVVRNSWSTETFTLVDDRSELGISGWMRQGRASELLAQAGYNIGELRKQAEQRSFKPVPLPVTIELRTAVHRRSLQGANIAAILPGKGDKTIVLTAHYDHFGIGRTVAGDNIYNGAVDNGTALATLLALTQAYAGTPRESHPTLVFVAADAEEAGILGSKYYTRHPATPLDRTLATINFEMTNPWGLTHDITAIGAGHSTLAELLDRVLAKKKLVSSPDSAPEQGFFFRSDQIAWAQAGVPALWIDGGVDYVGRPSGWGEGKRNEYRAKTYHQPSDDVKPDFDYAGMVQVAQVAAALVEEIAAAGHVEWLPTSEFARISR